MLMDGGPSSGATASGLTKLVGGAQPATAQPRGLWLRAECGHWVWEASSLHELKGVLIRSIGPVSRRYLPAGANELTRAADHGSDLRCIHGHFRVLS